MHPSYRDILSRIQERPLWWDQRGVPRYEPFHPDLSSNLYAEEIVLIEIACQGCHTRYFTEVCWSKYDGHPANGTPALSSMVRDIYYGDPPNAGCCKVGPTMSSIPLHTLEFWKRENFVWVRRPDLEGLVIDTLY